MEPTRTFFILIIVAFDWCSRKRLHSQETLRQASFKPLKLLIRKIEHCLQTSKKHRKMWQINARSLQNELYDMKK